MIAGEWSESELTDEVDRRQISTLNARVLQRLWDERLFQEAATQEDVDRVIEWWSFPLTRLNLDETKISRTELRLQRERRSASESHDGYQ